MPYIDDGEEYKTGNFDLIVRLKKKDEKIHFRVIGKSYYDGKHFLKNEDQSWNIVPCERINLKAPCEYCERYFDTIRAGKVTNDKALMEKAKKAAEPWKASLSFYIPIIDRESGTFKVLQTGLSVRTKLEEEVKIGTPIMERDFVLMRTEKPGAAYYSLSRLDSADTKPFTKEEKAEVEKFASMDLEDIVGGKVDEGSQASAAVEESKSPPPTDDDLADF